MRLPLERVARGLGKSLSFHLGPETPLEVAQGYTSTTPLGEQITALQSIYANMGSLTGGTVAQNLTVLGAEAALGSVLVQLVAIDQAQVKAAAGASSDGGAKASGPSGAEPGISPLFTGVLATATAAAGGIVGWVAHGEFGSGGKRK